MIEEQTVKARAVEAALGYTSQDNEQVAIDFVLLEGPNENAHITYYGSFSEKAVEHTLKALRTCGWEGDDLSDLSGIDANEVELVIAHEEDLEGQLRARIRWVNAPGSRGIAMKTRMDEGAAKAFAERMKGHVLAHKQRTNGAPTPEPQGRRAASGGGQRPQTNTAASAARNRGRSQPAEQPTDDDIPF